MVREPHNGPDENGRREHSHVTREHSYITRTSRRHHDDNPPDTASTARCRIHLETLGTIAEQVGEFELAVARMANDPAMDVGEAPELLGRAGNRLGDVREMLRKIRRDVIEA